MIKSIVSENLNSYDVLLGDTLGYVINKIMTSNGITDGNIVNIQLVDSSYLKFVNVVIFYKDNQTK